MIIVNGSLPSRKKKEDKLSCKLFLLTAISDLLTNSYPTLHIIYFTTSPRLDLRVFLDYQHGVPHIFKHYAIPSMFICSFGCTSQVITFVLSIVRAISVYRPFLSLRIPHWIPLGYIAVFSFIMFTNEALFAILHFCYDSVSQDKGYIIVRAIEITVEICYGLNIVHFILAIVASIATMAKILRRKKLLSCNPDTNTRSCWIIFLMNVPYFFSMINYTLCKTLLKEHNYFFLVYVAIPCFTSMFNPLVIVLLNKELKQFIKSLIGAKRVKDSPNLSNVKDTSY